MAVLPMAHSLIRGRPEVPDRGSRESRLCRLDSRETMESFHTGRERVLAAMIGPSRLGVKLYTCIKETRREDALAVGK